MATTYLYRTAGTPTSSKKFTISAWIKFIKVGTEQHLFGAFDDTSNRTHFVITDTGQLDLIVKVSGSNIARLKSTAVMRDNNAWYHVLAKFDTTQVTNSDRAKIYINGTQISAFETETYPSQDAVAETQGTHDIGAYNNGGSRNNIFDGCMAHFHFTDGYAYDASTFGQTDATTGIWKPTTGPSVTYGTNGFFLKFSNSASLGTDSSGNTNTFTKAGSGLQTKDTPSNNTAVINYAIPTVSQNCTVSNGGTTINSTSSAHRNSPAGIALALGNGKFYWEMKVETMTTHVKTGVGFTEWSKYTYLNQGEEFSASNEGYAYRNDGQKENNGISSYGNSYTVNDIIGVAFDTENRKLFFAKNGTWQNSGDPAAGSNEAFTVTADFVYYPVVNLYEAKVSYNFGAGYFGTSAIASEGTNASAVGKFEYDVPTGYTAVSTKGLNL